MYKVTIIGAGSVGATVAYTLALDGFVSELVLIDVNNEKALGEAMDIRQGMPFFGSVKLYAGSYSDAAGSNLVIITSGVARRPGQSRLDLVKTNTDILKSIIPEITKYAPDAVYIIVSNPVDILTYVFARRSGIPENRIIGTGTILDTARLRERLAEVYSINSQNVHAHVFGEHGDSSFVPWSIASISGLSFEDYHDASYSGNVRVPIPACAEIEQYVRQSGKKIIERKGATFYAIALSVRHICKCVFRGSDSTLTVSTMLHGEYGIDNVCLSVLSVVGQNGISKIINARLSPAEIEKLRQSAEALKEIIRQVED